MKIKVIIKSKINSSVTQFMLFMIWRGCSDNQISMTLFYFRNRGCIELDGKRERNKWKARDKETVVFLCTISYDRVFFPCRWLASLPGKETCTERDEEKIEKNCWSKLRAIRSNQLMVNGVPALPTKERIPAATIRLLRSIFYWSGCSAGEKKDFLEAC